MNDGAGFADKMNAMPKYVVSTSLARGAWNNTTVIPGNVRDEVEALKKRVEGDILVYGSGRLVQTLMRHDLVDEYRLMVYPIVLGGGNRLFGETDRSQRLRLAESRRAGESLILTYRPDRAAVKSSSDEAAGRRSGAGGSRRPRPAAPAGHRQGATTMDMRLELVPVPVADVDRAKAFYGKIGFGNLHDVKVSDAMRVVQFTPPGSACAIVFGTGMGELTAMKPGSVKGLHLVVADIEEARAELAGRGAVMGEIIDIGGREVRSFQRPRREPWLLQQWPR